MRVLIQEFSNMYHNSYQNLSNNKPLLDKKSLPNKIKEESQLNRKHLPNEIKEESQMKKMKKKKK